MVADRCTWAACGLAAAGSAHATMNAEQTNTRSPPPGVRRPARIRAVRPGHCLLATARAQQQGAAEVWQAGWTAAHPSCRLAAAKGPPRRGHLRYQIIHPVNQYTGPTFAKQGAGLHTEHSTGEATSAARQDWTIHNLEGCCCMAVMGCHQPRCLPGQHALPQTSTRSTQQPWQRTRAQLLPVGPQQPHQAT